MLPDIIFLDIVMPNRTGFEIINAIREEGINPCFIFVTGHTSREISDKLSLSKYTVDTHRRNILDKSGLRSTAELIRYCVG